MPRTGKTEYGVYGNLGLSPQFFCDSKIKHLLETRLEAPGASVSWLLSLLHPCFPTPLKALVLTRHWHTLTSPLSPSAHLHDLLCSTLLPVPCLPDSPTFGHGMEYSWFSCYDTILPIPSFLCVPFWLPHHTHAPRIPPGPYSLIFSPVSQSPHGGRGPRCASPARTASWWLRATVHLLLLAISMWRSTVHLTNCPRRVNVPLPLSPCPSVLRASE